MTARVTGGSTGTSHMAQGLVLTSCQVCYKSLASFVYSGTVLFIPFLYLLTFFTSKPPFRYFFSLKDFATPCKTQ